MVAVLAQVDALPGPQLQPPSRTGIVTDNPEQRRFDVGGHVVGPLGGVHEVGGVFGEAWLPQRSRSLRTSGSAFSLMASEAEVCCRNRFKKPTRRRRSCGKAAKISEVTR